ncbi:MAG: hypothetical protein ACTSVU_02445 [Promethearchaeota archaeon]
MSKENPFNKIHLNQPNIDSFNAQKDKHKKRVDSISKELNGIYTVSEKTLNKRFTI